MKLTALLTLKTAGLKAETANARIKSFEEKQNNFVTRRFSPGYGDRELKTQKDFLKWLGAVQIGISLTEACLMQPEKSVSAVIGAWKIIK